MTIDELCQEERKLNLHSTRKQGEYPFALEDSYERKTKRYKEINIDLLYNINKITQEEIQLLQEIEESELIKKRTTNRKTTHMHIPILHQRI